MAEATVHLIKGSKVLLTKETIENGIPTGVLCDKDGKALGRDEQHLARECYMDSMSSEYYMKVSPEEAGKIRADGSEPIYLGVGDVIGHFVWAPDHTLQGRHGEGPTGSNIEKPETEEATA